jgi:cytosine/adenosine deaminase-related metal-dependent hydrolase
VSSRTLIRGGCVLTLAHKSPNFTEADVLIEDDKIVEVGPGLRARDAEVIDASDTIVMPGFVDTHRHTWKSLIRNLGATGSNGEAPVASAAYGQHHQPDDVYAATLIGLLGAVEAGITTVVDWSDIQINDLFTDAVVQAHIDSGLRTVLVHSVPSWAGDREEPGVALRRFVKARAKAPSNTTVAAGADDPQRDDLDRVIREWTLARELGLRIHSHAGMDRADSGVISDLAGKDLLGNDVTLVHCTYLNGADLDAVVSKGAVVSLAPSSEMGEGSGSLAIQELIDREIRPGLGIDDERVAPGDMFAQMRAAISIQHATLFDLKLAGKAGVPHLLSTRDVIRYATTDGARVAGLEAVTGSLEPGKQADIVMLRTDRPNIFPINDPIGAVVWGMDTSNVDCVFVAGKVLMRHGALTADVKRARSLAITAQRRLAAASGLLVGTSYGGSG